MSDAQQSLFPEPRPRGLMSTSAPTHPRELRRNTGPSTSDAAARAVFPHVGKLQRRVVDLIKAHPDKTALELTKIAGDDDPRKINRRLGEVETMGLVVRGVERVCAVSGRRCATWRAA